MLKLKLQYFGHLMRRTDSFGKTWCWERLKAGGEGDDRGWDGWMAPATQWTWVWVDSGSWWWTGKPNVLQSMRSQRIGHDWVTELNWTELWVDISFHAIARFPTERPAPPFSSSARLILQEEKDVFRETSFCKYHTLEHRQNVLCAPVPGVFKLVEHVILWLQPTKHSNVLSISSF